MRDWLSATWEPNWKSFQYFNFYRLIVAALLWASFFLPFGWRPVPRMEISPSVEAILLFYVLLVGISTLISARWRLRFNMQLTTQVSLDVAAVGLIMYALGGVTSGAGIVLMISLAAASLVGRGRLVLFYAALATIAVLGMQMWGILSHDFESASIFQAGLLSGGFFATAVLARLLGQRAMMHEDLARRRGVALDNQIRIGLRIMERMQDGVLVVDRQGTALHHNPGAEILLGMPHRDGTTLADHSRQLANAFRSWVNHGDVGSVDFEGSGGSQLRARFEATDSSEGEALVFIEDVGRIRTQARQLKLASLGRLTASIAHEIRNPLASISHASDLLHEERRGDIQDRLLRILRDNVFRLDRIVQDILQLGRNERAQPECLRIEEFLHGFIEEFSAVERVESGVIVTEVATKFWLFDRSNLLQILWNLVGNAVRYSTRQPGSVCLRALYGTDGRVELHVIDDGPGVPEEYREQIFEPFFTTRHQGTGLGLFIARELCEANGASLQLGPRNSGHFVIVGGEKCQPTSADAAPEAM
ncbi:MAG: two-component system sensor histidine kinase NtrB [Betaproteobacteria bacterium]